MATDYEECSAVAERAVEWLIRLQDATSAERKAFMCWLRQSPSHVREFLLASACQGLLQEHLAFVDADTAALLAEAHAGEMSVGAKVRDARSLPELSVPDECRDAGVRKRPHSLRRLH